MKQRVLVSTIAPANGGVVAMAGFLARTIADRGMTPVLAHYEPYSLSPHFSVPSYRLISNRVGTEQRVALEGYETHAIGAFLPELEFTHFRATPPWRRVMESCNAYVAVSGNVLAVTPYVQTGRPFVGWVASGWDADRKDRVARYPLARRLLDRTFVRPVTRRLEHCLLHAGTILALSDYTRRTLNRLAGKDVVAGILPMPVEADFFTPAPERVTPLRIGFSGRLNDPRKNLGLLISSLVQARAKGIPLTAELIGGSPDETTRQQVRAAGLDEVVAFTPYLSKDELRDHLQSLDIYVIPSWQEGLCIAALEAMACGCPVVSTRCGGPEEFVRDGASGCLVDFDPAQMADAIIRIVNRRTLRQGLSQGARKYVEEHYTRQVAEPVFWKAFDRQFPQSG